MSLFTRLLQRSCDILFLCSSTVDEVWIRSTARACRKRGLSARLAVCDDGCGQRERLMTLYGDVGIQAQFGLSLTAAARIRCRVAVTASSDLDRKIFPTRATTFVHMPHSLVSLHMIYPADAFDGYDVLLAAGPHHDVEFAAIAAARRLINRRSIAAGYGKLDVLAEKVPSSVDNGDHVLIAPSWGADNLLDRCGVELAEVLAGRGFTVTIRPHPLFLLERAPVVEAIRELVARVPRVRLESPLDGDRAMLTANLMIGDYSGTSFEFAALRRLPVISVDVGLKVVNPDWRALGLTPVEISHRAALGPVVAPEVEAITAAVSDCMSGLSEYKLDDATVASFLYQTPGECGTCAAAILEEMLSAA